MSFSINKISQNRHFHICQVSGRVHLNEFQRKRAYLTDYTTRKKKALSAKKPKPEPQPVEEEEESGDEQGKNEEDKEEDPRNNVKQPSVMR